MGGNQTIIMWNPFFGELSLEEALGHLSIEHVLIVVMLVLVLIAQCWVVVRLEALEKNTEV